MEARERLERHRQRLVAPGELLGEEILGGSMRRPCTAVVLSSRATILVLNAKEAKQFFKNDLVKIAKFNAKFIASIEDIYAKLRAHQSRSACGRAPAATSTSSGRTPSLLAACPGSPTAKKGGHGPRPATAGGAGSGSGGLVVVCGGSIWRWV